MRHTSVGFLLLLLLTAFPAPLAARAINVRIYNNVGIPREDLRMAQDLAATILGNAGIEVSWQECWFRDREAVDASPSCRQPNAANDLILRLQATHPASNSKYVSMGFSVVGSGPAAAFLATVFEDVVQTVARGASVDWRTVLGQAIAHEIGHLLLNTNSHAAAGLMRADWSRAELRRNARADWQFLADEGAAMRAAVATRAALSTR